MTGEKMICGYGCGREAKYPPKKGQSKWSCEEQYRLCPNISESKSQKMKDHWNDKDGNFNTKEFRSKLRDGVKKSWENDSERKEKLVEWNNKNWNDKDSFFHTEQRSEKIREKASNIWKDPVYKENHSKKISLGMRQKIFPISFFENKHPLFSKIEEMRYNPDNKSEIQVHCKYNKCKNSKENNGWFTPTSSQLGERVRSIEKVGTDTGYFYCSQECKDLCPLFNSRGEDPFRETEEKEIPYTPDEYQTFREHVLELDKFECQICGTKSNVHVHHIIPQKLEPMFTLDPINGICLCEKCHYKYGHKDDGCKTSDLASKQCKGRYK